MSIALISFCILAPAAGSKANRDHRQRNARILLNRHSQMAIRNQEMRPNTTAGNYKTGFRGISGTQSRIFFQDDAEHGTAGWTTGGIGDTTAQWHLTTRDANSPTHSWWAGVEPYGTYETGHRVYQYLTSPSIDLTGASGPVRLLFTENYFTEAGWDFCMVDAKGPSDTAWTHLRGGYAGAPSGDSYGWIVTTLDLTQWANSSVTVRFVFDTGDSLVNSFPGWFVDNVTVFDEAGTIAGSVWFDENKNGLRDSTEVGMSDWPVTVSGPLTIVMRTNENGDFRQSLPLGSYSVSEYLPAPWVLTTTPAVYNITLTTPDQLADSVIFGDYRPGSVIRGTVFNDVDRDSLFDAGDSTLGGRTIDIEAEGQILIGSHISDSAGRYSFIVYSTGNYTLLEYLADRWISTFPGGNPARQTVTVPVIDTTISGINFGSYEIPPVPATGVLRGWVFDDLNNNGVRDEHEPGIPNRIVALWNSGEIGEVATDSAGSFFFQNLVAGSYSVRLPDRYGWHRTKPDSFYVVALPEGGLRDSLEFGEYQYPTTVLRGLAFNDLNRNSIYDTLEPPLAGWTVGIVGPSGFEASAVTDSAGHYRIDGLATGILHGVSLSLQPHWQQSYPLSPVSVIPVSDTLLNQADFGAYALNPGSIGGIVFNDLNANGVYDPGEPGIRGFQVQMTGDFFASSTSDDTGAFSFTGLWPGTYRMALVWQSHWRQTLPPLLQPATVPLGNEQNLRGVLFGVRSDTSFNLSLRSCTPENLAYSLNSRGKPGTAEKMKPIASEGVYEFASPDDSITGMHVEFSQVMLAASMTCTRFDPAKTVWSSANVVTLRMPADSMLNTGDPISMYIKAPKGRITIIKRVWWMKAATGDFPIGLLRYVLPMNGGRLLLPMPNWNNVGTIILTNGYFGPRGLVVGRTAAPAFVYHLKWTDVFKSLWDKHQGLPVGPERCLDRYAYNGKPIIRPIRTLTPTRGNNRLITEVIALKVGIAASDLGISPEGFGGLVFNEGTPNPFNGLTVRAIASLADSAVSAADMVSKLNPGGGDTCLCSAEYFHQLYRTIRMIDSAFAGPFDTLSWGSPLGLTITPVRAVADVPYLHLDSSFSRIALSERRPLFERAVAGEFSLAQNYPNPFNPTTTIGFTLPDAGLVTLKVYNTLGQEVATLYNRVMMDEGWQETEFSADQAGLSSGVYFYRLSIETIPDNEDTAARIVTMVKKMVLVR